MAEQWIRHTNEKTDKNPFRFAQFWSISQCDSENQWEISEAGRLGCFSEFFVSDRYTSDYALFFTKHHKLYPDDGRDSMYPSGLENGTTPTVNKMSKCTKYFTIEKDDLILICDICDE